MQFHKLIGLGLACSLLSGCAAVPEAATDPTEQPAGTIQVCPEPDEPDTMAPEPNVQKTASEKPELMTGPGHYDNQKDYDTYKKEHDQYLAWLAQFRSEYDLAAIQDSYRAFLTESTAAVFQDKETLSNKNPSYSPLSMYAALCMLAQCANNDTQSDILSFCHLDSLEAAGLANRTLYHGLTFKDGDTVLSMANSLWVNKYLMDNSLLKQDAVTDIREESYTDLFGAGFGSPDADAAIKEWTEQETDGLISADIQTESDMVALLINALLYKDSWQDAFLESQTRPDTFTNTEGTETQTEFMHKSESGNRYLHTDTYDMGSIPSLHGEVRFILPKEGTSPTDLLSDESILSEITAANPFEGQDEFQVQWSVPKFDIDSDMDLTKTLCDAGLGNLKDDADFSRLCDQLDIGISQIRQLCHIKADENGFESAAVTVLTMKTNAIVEPPKPVEMNLNRPFAFVILSENTPLFIGTVTELQ